MDRNKQIRINQLIAIWTNYLAHFSIFSKIKVSGDDRIIAILFILPAPANWFATTFFSYRRPHCHQICNMQIFYKFVSRSSHTVCCVNTLTALIVPQIKLEIILTDCLVDRRSFASTIWGKYESNPCHSSFTITVILTLIFQPLLPIH